MKAKKVRCIMVHSGKGGVGKTTITAMLGVELANKGHKVIILDADLNTPSMPVIFPDKTVKYKEGSLKIFSSGYRSKAISYLMGESVSIVLSKLIAEIKKEEKDFVLIDTPPGISAIHTELIRAFEISGVLLISEPTILSYTDVEKTMPMFVKGNIGILGILINKQKNNNKFNATKIPIVSEIAESQKYNKLTENGNFSLKRFPEIQETIKIIKKSAAIKWESLSKKELFFSDITEREIEEELDRKPYSRKLLKFHNVETWDYVRFKLLECDPWGDQFLVYNDAKKIENIIDSFGENEMSFFIIIRAPNTEVPLFPGEIGIGRLSLQGKGYYGIPRINYDSGEGDIVLFSHEVSPTNYEYIMDVLQSGEMILHPKFDNRFIPTFEILEMVENAFGDRTGIHPLWRERYREMGVLM